MQPQQQGQAPVRYKTMLCKHYDTQKGCVYNEKCQFAHGAHELKSTINVKFHLINFIFFFFSQWAHHLK